MKMPLFATLAAMLAVAQAHAACTYPTEPAAIPDGSKATKEEMIAAQKSVKDFDAAIITYTACLKSEHEAAIAKLPEGSEEQKKEMERVMASKYDAAISADEALAARFNEQVKAYKAKSTPPAQ